MKEQTYNLVISVLVVIAVVLGYGVYKDVSSVSNQNDEMQDSVVGENKDISDKSEKSEDEKITDNTINDSKDIVAIPDLERPVIILAEISPEAEELSREKITSLTLELLQNSELFSAWLELAAYRKTIGDYLGAIEIWEFMTKSWADSNAPYDNLGNIYHYQLKNLVKSEVNFIKAIEKDPNYIATYINLYDLYTLSYTEKINLADDILLEGIENNSGNIILLSTLAQYFADLGDIDNAKKYYNEALNEASKLDDKNLQAKIEAIIEALDK